MSAITETPANSTVVRVRNKICFLLNNEFVFDNRVYREAQALIEAGYEVTLLCARDVTRLQPAFENRDGIAVHRILSKRLLTFKPFTRGHVVGLIKAFKNFGGFDYVHAHDANMLLLGWALSRLWKAKLVYDSHELWSSVYKFERDQLVQEMESQSRGEAVKSSAKASRPLSKGRFKRKMSQLNQVEKLENWLLPKCDGLISVNDTITKQLNERTGFLIPHSASVRNITSYYALDSQNKPRRFHEQFNLSQNAKVVLYQGGIAKIRGVGKLIEAMCLIARQDVVLVLMGPFMDSLYTSAFIEQLVNANNLQGRVFYKEAVSGSDLLNWTASADLGLAPILNVRESYYLCLPNKLFEYIQAGLPCGTSDFPEMKKLVDAYQVGFTFNPELPEEIAKQVDEFFNLPERQAYYRQNVLKAKNELHWENEKKQLVAFYEALSQ
jgi:glycosyltransferase involved in cell wall biosynthesis